MFKPNLKQLNLIISYRYTKNDDKLLTNMFNQGR